MDARNAMGMLMAAVSLVTVACGPGPDCSAGQCAGPVFDGVELLTAQTLVVRPGVQRRLIAECADSPTVRVLEMTRSHGNLRVDHTTFRAPGMDASCTLVVEAPRLRRLVNASSGHIDVDADFQSDSVTNTGGGSVRLRGAVGRHLNVVNSGTGLVRVDRADVDTLEADNDGAAATRLENISARWIEVHNRSVDDVTLSTPRAEHVVLDNQGLGYVVASGTSAWLDVELDRSGDVDASMLVARRVNVVSQGLGDALITATQVADVTVNSGGDVYVYGEPRELYVSGYGLGQVWLY